MFIPFNTHQSFQCIIQSILLIKNYIFCLQQDMRLPKERQEDYNFFKNYPQEDRPAYLQNILETPQIQGDANVLVKMKKYPSSAYFQFEGKNLNYNFIETTSKPPALMFFFHGMYCHGNTSGYLAEVVSKTCGINCFALDFLNAGKSQRPDPGLYESFDYLLDQAYQFIQFVLKRYTTKPLVFCCGLSMGGGITFQLGVKYPQLIRGILMYSPGLKQNKEDKPFLKKIANLIGCCFPMAAMIPQDFDNRSRLNIQQIVKNDPQFYLGNHINRTARIVLNQIDKIPEYFNELKISYIIFQGGVDKYCDPFQAIDLERQSPSKDKTTVYYKHMWHDIFFQPQIAQISQLSAAWIKERIRRI